MKALLIILFAVVYAGADGAEDVIYELDPKDYYRMPPKYHLDRFNRCVRVPGGMYCTVYADVVSDEPSELLDMMKAFSAHNTTHYNYTNVRYGLCMSSTCKQFYDGDNTRPALWNSSEACLNDSFSREHDLKVRVTDIVCHGHGHKFELNNSDYAILAFLGLIVALNVIGNIYDFYIRDENEPGNRFLMNFSIRKNWRALVAPPWNDPKHPRLQCFHGFRAMTSLCVVFGHVPLSTINAAINPEGYEATFKPKLSQILHVGHLIPTTFFTISGFLLSYNTEVTLEKQKLRWTHWAKTMFMRWLRLSPANIATLLITAVYFKFIPIGPLFKEIVMRESMDCRRYWIYNLMNALNFNQNTQCNLQVWSLAADYQLYAMCLAILVFSPSRRVRYWLLGALYLYGVGYPAYQVYSRNLDGSYISSPTVINTYYTAIPTFYVLLSGTATNATGFIIGMVFGSVVYSLHKQNFFSRNFTKYRYLIWLAAGLAFAVEMTGGMFLADAPRPSLLVRVLFIPIVRPLFAITVNLLIFGCICKCDDLIRGIMEWEGWMFLSRLSYCTYLVHLIPIRATGATRDALFHLSTYHLAEITFGLICMTLLFSCLLHLMVEAPFGGIIKMATSPAKPAKLVQDKQGNGQAKKDVKAD